MRTRKAAPPREVRVAESGVIAQLIPRGRSGDQIEVTLDNGQSYVLHTDLVLEFRFVPGLSVDAETVQQAIDADDLIAAKAVAGRQLAYRPRSVSELRAVLAQRGFRPGTVSAVINRFTELGYLNDAEFAERWIANRSALAPRGERLLRHELRQKGVQPELIESSLEDANLDDFETALALASHRFTKLAGLERETQRRRIAGFLERRGFGYDVVRKVDRALFDNAPRERDSSEDQSCWDEE